MQMKSTRPLARLLGQQIQSVNSKMMGGNPHSPMEEDEEEECLERTALDRTNTTTTMI